MLVAIATIALLVLAVVLVTGGFLFEVGSVRVSSRRPAGPLIVAALACLVLARRGRTEVQLAAAEAAPFIDRHAASIVVVLASACAGAGIGYGTYAASGSDPSGYVSHASLLARREIVDIEPLAAEVAWPDAGWAFSPLGYRPAATVVAREAAARAATVRDETPRQVTARGAAPIETAVELVPGYPLGLPALMAVALLVAGEQAPFLVVPLLGAFAVLACFGLGARLHSRTAGVAAAALMATSPVLLFQVVQPMSDVPAAAWIVLALLAALTPGWAPAIAAGGAFAMAVATRPNLLPLGLPVIACAAGWPAARGRPWSPRRAMLAASGMFPVGAVLMVVQWRLYGSPLATGYGGLDQYFAWANVLPNAGDYAAKFVAGESPAIVLTAAALVAIGFGARRKARGSTRPAGRPAQGFGLPDALRDAGDLPRGGHAWAGALTRLRPSVLLAVAGTLCLLLVYLPYGVFPDWAYLRFFLPAMALGFVAAGAVLAEGIAVLPSPARGLALALGLTLACSANTVVAGREQAFNLRRYESRYRSVGRYLEAALPDNAVVVTSQESGSVRYYTSLPVLRWDLLSVDLDAALAFLRRRGRHPVLVIEDWERPLLRARFPRSETATRDWPLLADIGETTRVWVIDPAVRGPDDASVPVAAAPAAPRRASPLPTTDRFR